MNNVENILENALRGIDAPIKPPKSPHNTPSPPMQSAKHYDAAKQPPHTVTQPASQPQYPIKLRTDYKAVKPMENSKIHVCLFRIINTPIMPFLQYNLYKYPEKHKNQDIKNLMVFPFTYYGKNTSIEKIISKQVKSMLPHKKTYNKVKTIGYLSRGIDYFFFFDLNKITKIYDYSFVDQEKKKINDPHWWCGIDEICNHQKVLQYPIHRSVSQLFLRNKSLIFLKDKKGQRVEIPRVAYFGDAQNDVAVKLMSGRLLHDDLQPFGPYQYLTDLSKAIRHAGWTRFYNQTDCASCNRKISSEGIHKKGMVLRIFVFLGKLKVILNQPEDPYYTLLDCLKPRKQFNDDCVVYDREKRGEWAMTYDTLFQGVLKDKKYKTVKYLNDTPLMVIKDPLAMSYISMHNLDTKSLDARWSRGELYRFR